MITRRHALSGVAASMLAPFVPGRVTAQESAARVTILFDAFGKTSDLKRGWGYSAFIEYAGRRYPLRYRIERCRLCIQCERPWRRFEATRFRRSQPSPQRPYGRAQPCPARKSRHHDLHADRDGRVQFAYFASDDEPDQALRRLRSRRVALFRWKYAQRDQVRAALGRRKIRAGPRQNGSFTGLLPGLDAIRNSGNEGDE
jgi:hypothetical protein